ncbi:RxLR effector protein [Phytophthora megakarya]|uniref:RxLR effector protein n=1 Tax=Phytophthora megakarya TaxID=4795 RepID=A0A225WCI9_9STRA|nr:RxLR effector protein [Phytophthora megakarya]
METSRTTIVYVGVDAAQKNKTLDAVHEKTNVNEKERATAYKWSSTLADRKSKLFPSPLQKWIKAHVHLTDIYDTLRLAETSTNLEHGNSWFWDSEMVGLFRNTMPDEDVVRLSHTLGTNQMGTAQNFDRFCDLQPTPMETERRRRRHEASRIPIAVCEAIQAFVPDAVTKVIPARPSETPFLYDWGVRVISTVDESATAIWMRLAS